MKGWFAGGLCLLLVGCGNMQLGDGYTGPMMPGGFGPGFGPPEMGMDGFGMMGGGFGDGFGEGGGFGFGDDD